MKIAFFVSEFPALSETFIVNQIIALKKAGHLVHIYSIHTPWNTTVHKNIVDYDLQGVTFYLDKNNLSRTKKMRTLIVQIVKYPFSKYLVPFIKSVFKNNSPLSVYEFISFVGKPNYDVVHAHFGDNANYVCKLRLLGLFSNTRFITTFHGYDLDGNFLKNNYYNLLFSECNFYTVNTAYSKKLLKHLGCDEEKIHILPVGLDTQMFMPAVQKNSEDEGLLRILFVGRLVRFKAPHLVLQICNILKHRNIIRFNATIIGDGELMQEMQQMLKEFNLESQVSLMGAKTQEEIITIMKQSDIFLYPGITYNGRAENQGLVIQEAQAMQLPVLVSDAGGIKEGVVDEITGFVLPESDINAFVKKIELLAKNKKMLHQMGKQGRMFIKEKYDSQVLNQKLLEIYLVD